MFPFGGTGGQPSRGQSGYSGPYNRPGGPNNPGGPGGPGGQGGPESAVSAGASESSGPRERDDYLDRLNQPHRRRYPYSQDNPESMLEYLKEEDKIIDRAVEDYRRSHREELNKELLQDFCSIERDPRRKLPFLLKAEVERAEEKTMSEAFGTGTRRTRTREKQTAESARIKANSSSQEWYNNNREQRLADLKDKYHQNKAHLGTVLERKIRKHNEMKKIKEKKNKKRLDRYLTQ